jgi:hypothetical protein
MQHNYLTRIQVPDEVLAFLVAELDETGETELVSDSRHTSHSTGGGPGSSPASYAQRRASSTARRRRLA